MMYDDCHHLVTHLKKCSNNASSWDSWKIHMEPKISLQVRRICVRMDVAIFWTWLHQIGTFAIQSVYPYGSWYWQLSRHTHPTIHWTKTGRCPPSLDSYSVLWLVYDGAQNQPGTRLALWSQHSVKSSRCSGLNPGLGAVKQVWGGGLIYLRYN